MAAIRDRLNGATPGPWFWWMSEAPPFEMGRDGKAHIGVRASTFGDAQFVAFWERDRRIGRGLGITWSLIGFSALLLYASIAWSVIR